MLTDIDDYLNVRRAVHISSFYFIRSKIYRLFCLILFLHLSVVVVYFCCLYVVVVVFFFRSVKLLIKLGSLQRRSKVCLIG